MLASFLAGAEGAIDLVGGNLTVLHGVTMSA
jgi:hypothetical protein